MQDRYAGDVGDFGKFGLLRNIAGTGLKIGINWYRSYKPEEHKKGDGKYIGYLYDKSFLGCDDELLESLRSVVESDRSIAALEGENLIPNARYYSEILKPGNDSIFSRDLWFEKSQEVLADSDIIFCDPDNGLLVKSVSLNSSKSDKYITEKELLSYYGMGKSVIFYNHRSREKEAVYLRRFVPLMEGHELRNAKWKALKFARGSVRDYFFILQPPHVNPLEAVISDMMKSNWNKHFSIMDVRKIAG
ncbi:MAG: hypothetical protein GX318_06980 [Clostridia bacterium]|mgnify:CR=1 FL=1|nr:hypothetical protein [Clostridia bacterium]